MIAEKLERGVGWFVVRLIGAALLFALISFVCGKIDEELLQ